MAANTLSSMLRRSTPRMSAPSAAPVGTISRAWACPGRSRGAKGMSMDSHILALAGITLLAATVNGALGYGFSSLTVPVAVLFYANRVLNPALVLVEIVVNTYSLFINRNSVPRVWRRTVPILIGLVPGVIVGSVLLATLNATGIKLITYVVLLPLILLQAAGVRRRVRAERVVGLPLGAGIGVLYSITTISGPPL